MKYLICLLLFLALCQIGIAQKQSALQIWSKQYKIYLGAGISLNEARFVEFFDNKTPFLLNGMIAAENKHTGWGLRLRREYQIEDREYYVNQELLTKQYLQLIPYFPVAITKQVNNTALEFSKNIYSPLKTNKKLYIGGGIGLAPPKYAMATLFVAVPVHWLWVEVRGQVGRSNWTTSTERGILFLSAYYRFSPKITLKPRNP
jgi:hypothetical protein